jgi:lysophospholipase L1-like esterase
MSSFQRIAALGSSFAAGPGIEPIVDPAAGRSGRNYASQLAERLEADLVDLTVSGATTANILDTPQQVVTGEAYPPQIEGLPADVDVVTVTAGGNDLSFLGAMLYFAWQRLVPDSPTIEMMKSTMPGGVPVPTEGSVEQATSGLVRVVEAARAQAPGARVVLVDYLTILDETSRGAGLFSEDQLDQLLVIQSAVARAFAVAAARTGAELVRASALSAGHALGSAEPWVQPFYRDPARTGASFHPNDAGMTAIAAELERVLTH